MHVGEILLHILTMTAGMAWEILWALILGFALSGVVQAVVSKQEMSRLLPDDGSRTLLVACGLGAASSSCSYAATALARSMFRKGANFTAAIAFQFASTNLVIELGILLALMVGWQFTLAEFVGGPMMIFILVALFRAFLKKPMVEAAERQAQKGLAGRMEGHAAMDMSIHSGSIWKRATSPQGFTAISHFFFMDWDSLWLDLVAGIVIAGVLAVLVPRHFWEALFLAGHPVAAKLWGPFLGPIVAVFSFVCSIGNVPLAAVLWNGGISFGGVVSFIFADLIVLPILDIYRKYYGLKMSVFLFATFYSAMALAGLVIELLFSALHLVPQQRHAQVVEAHFSWNYTTWLNLVFLAFAAVLLWRFLNTGGPAMLKMMDEDPEKSGGHGCHHDASHEHAHHGHTH